MCLLAEVSNMKLSKAASLFYLLVFLAALAMVGSFFAVYTTTFSNPHVTVRVLSDVRELLLLQGNHSAIEADPGVQYVVRKPKIVVQITNVSSEVDGTSETSTEVESSQQELITDTLDSSASREVRTVQNTSLLINQAESENKQAGPQLPSIQRKGFVLAANFYEQQTMALRNMFQLQCWANTLHLSVVKPLLKDSTLRTPLEPHKHTTMLKFEDFFNTTEWGRVSKREGYAPLVDWEDFLELAPRKVIAVRFEYASVSMLKARQRAGQPVVHLSESSRFKSGCKSAWPNLQELAFLKANGFDIVRTVCFNFYYGDELQLEEFNSHLLGGFQDSEVTVILDMWRGISSGQRVLVKNTCSRVFSLQEFITPSDRVERDAEKYIAKYHSSEPYLAVMGRLEMSTLTVHKRQPILPYCFQETMKELRAFESATNLHNVFLSIDIGKYGTKRYRSHIDNDLARDFTGFFRGIYEKLSIYEWERGFELAAGTRDPGYIALLQKVIVTKAKCVLFVGGGAFQRHALNLYRKRHPLIAEQCIRVVKSCTSPTKFIL